MSESNQKRKHSREEDDSVEPPVKQSPDKRHSEGHHHHSSHHKHSHSDKDGHRSSSHHRHSDKDSHSSHRKHSDSKSKENDSPKADADVPDQKAKTKNGKLESQFFDVPADDLAKKLLGQTFVRITADGKRLSARVVETEAFMGEEDKASHCYQGKRTGKNEALYMSPGTLYVYNLMGGKYCMKISSQGQ